jgi:transcriptional regulator with XRE-family HTH domain
MIQEELIMDDYSEDAATFGDRLALARESQGLTQEQLAKRLGLRVQTIQNWECDRSEPRANRLQMVAGFLNISMVWLLTGEGDGGPAQQKGGKALPEELSVLLGEIRDIRVANVKANDRLAKLEKRLRQMSEQA